MTLEPQAVQRLEHAPLSRHRRRAGCGGRHLDRPGADALACPESTSTVTLPLGSRDAPSTAMRTLGSPTISRRSRRDVVTAANCRAHTRQPTAIRERSRRRDQLNRPARRAHPKQAAGRTGKADQPGRDTERARAEQRERQGVVFDEVRGRRGRRQRDQLTCDAHACGTGQRIHRRNCCRAGPPRAHAATRARGRGGSASAAAPRDIDDQRVRRRRALDSRCDHAAARFNSAPRSVASAPPDGRCRCAPGC